MTAIRPEVAAAMEAADAEVPLLLSALKRVSGLTDLQLAQAIGLANPQDYRRRRIGETKTSVAELRGLAAFFEVQADLFLRPATEAITELLRLRPDLVAGVAGTQVTGR